MIGGVKHERVKRLGFFVDKLKKSLGGRLVNGSFVDERVYRIAEYFNALKLLTVFFLGGFYRFGISSREYYAPALTCEFSTMATPVLIQAPVISTVFILFHLIVYTNVIYDKRIVCKRVADTFDRSLANITVINGMLPNLQGLIVSVSSDLGGKENKLRNV